MSDEPGPHARRPIFSNIFTLKKNDQTPENLKERVIMDGSDKLNTNMAQKTVHMIQNRSVIEWANNINYA